MTEKQSKVFVPQSVGERVAHARRLLGVREGADILAPDLAVRVGVTINAVYAWETGTVPGPKNLQRLADELGVTPEWIHYGAGVGPTAGAADVGSSVPLTSFEIPKVVAKAAAEELRAPAPPPEEKKRSVPKKAKGRR